MQLKSWDRPGKSCGRFFDGVIHLTDRGFELQLVPPDISFKALKRGDTKLTKDTNTTLEKCVDELLDHLEESGASLKAKQEVLAELITSSISQAQPNALVPLSGGESSTQLAEESEPSPIGDLEAAIKGAFPSLTDEQIEDWLQVI